MRLRLWCALPPSSPGAGSNLNLRVSMATAPWQPAVEEIHRFRPLSSYTCYSLRMCVNNRTAWMDVARFNPFRSTPTINLDHQHVCGRRASYQDQRQKAGRPVKSGARLCPGGVNGVGTMALQPVFRIAMFSLLMTGRERDNSCTRPADPPSFSRAVLW